MTTLTVTFAAGQAGEWRIDSMSAIAGEGLPFAERLSVLTVEAAPAMANWSLRGVVSNARYTTASELKQLSNVSPGLGRPEAACAALIPIRKSPAWWALGQDSRRAIFEDRSAHIAKSMKYLPAVARRLHHARDLGEPFDFLTWFEFSPESKSAFEDLLGELRASEEWAYVDREVDIRLHRISG